MLAGVLPLSASIEIRSIHFTTSDGIANNTVRHIHQDNKGFLWLGTFDGLSRYDGNSFVNHYPFAEGESIPSLMDHRVRKMKEDCNGLLWIDVISEHQCCYDLKRGRFVDYTGCGEYMQNYSGTMQASNGDVWLRHERNGCRRVRYREGEFTSTVFRSDRGNLAYNDAIRVVEDESGTIYIVTRKALHRVQGDDTEVVLKAPSLDYVAIEGISYFVATDGRIFRKEESGIRGVTAIKGYSSLNVVNLMVLGNELYLFTNVGCFRYDTTTGTMERSARELDVKNAEVQKDNRGNYWIYNHTGIVLYVDADTRQVKRLRLLPEEKMYYIDFERYCFVHDSRGIIWISTYGNGLFAYNPLTEELQHFAANMDGYSHISSDYLLYVMEDRSGSIWVSSEYSGVSRLSVLNEGASYIYPENRSKEDDRSNNIRMLTQLNDGRIYVGTRRGGLYIYNEQMQLLEKKNFQSNIYAVTRDAKGRLWMGSRGEGLSVDGRWYKHRDDDTLSLSNDNIFSLLCDSKGRMWVGAFHGGLDLAVEKENGLHFRHFFDYTYTQKQVRALCEDKNGYIWMGTSSGVYVFHPDSLIANPAHYYAFNIQNGKLGSNEVKSLYSDRKGRMWIATSGIGVNVCDPKGDYANLTFDCYDTSNGLVNNMVQSIVEDHHGGLWIATEYGISYLDTQKLVFENYFFSSYVLGNTYCENSFCITSSGLLIFGSNYGMVVIEPDKTNYKTSYVTPTVALTGLKVNGMPMYSGEQDSPLQQAITYTQAIELDYDQNSFELDFSTFDYSKDGTVQYMYRLDNFDKNWSTPSALNFASYKNLDPGHYLLRVKACNAVGVWGERETVLRIVIEPPYWKTGWAYLLYVVLICLSIYLLLRVLWNFNDLRNRIQVEKQMTEYKLVFFTNISHEFRTPLTLIQGALEKLENCSNPKEMAYPLKVMNKSTQRMLRLINQLLEFRKMQNNKMALSLEETDVVAFLYEIFLTFQDTAEAKKMDFRFICSQESCRMYVDKGNVDKVTYNLLSNAFKYTPSGGTILLSVDVTDERLMIAVSDTGVGVPKEKREELFTRFVRGRFAGGGVGVGLHLTHELVTVHKGTIEYTENSGGGSVFTVMLPMDPAAYEEKDFLVPNQLLVEENRPHQREASPEVHEERANEEGLPAIAPLNSKKILIIEDDSDVREFLKQEIGHYFEVVAEADGKAGLERAMTYDADLIVCDVLMPEMSGFEVLRRLKSTFETSHIPVVLLTALASEDKQLEGLQSGADAYVTKPFSPKLLLTRIFKLIEQREKLREKFSQEPTSIRPVICSSGQDKDFADRLQVIMEKQMSNADFTIDDFAQLMKLGRTNFYRKVRGVTGYSPNEYMRVMRMKKAAELLATDASLTVSEVSYSVGMNDPFYFSKCFKQQFGVSPSAYQKGERNNK